ncbi:hypothetical protein CEQ21_09235 [Niallia circulans]|uniref:Intracellular proteinase inhibitor BsuPI domain-containing protein n=1 Tax=Niallia circulans TaxID=1397 RepID=A0A553SFP2_NIACI|nr:BsuPI-related putative proteinase inhibitor [Niallia circulans]TRZ35807.1 hypothetical protein CEQ21_09235 [Niallia circulans]
MLRAIFAAVLVVALFSFGGESFAQGNDLQFNVSAVPKKDYAEIKMTVANTSAKDMKLVFSSSQKYEIAIRAKGGKEVYRYSANKSFLQALQELKLKAGDTFTWVEKWNYRKSNGEFVPSGEYSIKATLLGRKSSTVTAKATLTVPERNMVTDLKVSGQKGKYTVEGKVNSTLSYTVEDGHEEIISKQPVVVGENGSFKLNLAIKEASLPKNGTLILYFQDEHGKISDPIVLQKFPS